MRNKRFHFLQEVIVECGAVRQDRCVRTRLVIAEGRLVGQLDASQPLDVHIAFPARQQQAHRIAVSGHDALAVLVERDHRIVERLV